MTYTLPADTMRPLAERLMHDPNVHVPALLAALREAGGDERAAKIINMLAQANGRKQKETRE